MPPPSAPVSFPLGRTLATPGALASITNDELLSALARHSRGDWGEVDPDDWHANDRALQQGSRLLSSYTTAAGVKFWIITEADRSATTTLLPDEY